MAQKKAAKTNRSQTTRASAGSATSAKSAPRKREKVKKVIHQVKEPLSLLQTLREEGMSNAITFLSLAGNFASGAAKNLRVETLRPQLSELISSLGFAMREDIERLEDRVAELEQKLSEREYAALRAADGEE